MKKTVIALSSLILSTASFSGELYQYWNKFYTHIRQCVSDEIKSSTVYSPNIPVEETSDLKAYLKALDYNGYAEFINTKNLTSSDICYLKFITTEKLGYTPKYYKPVEILVVSSFSRKADALSLKEKLQSILFHNSSSGMANDKQDIISIISLD